PWRGVVVSDRLREQLPRDERLAARASPHHSPAAQCSRTRWPYGDHTRGFLSDPVEGHAGLATGPVHHAAVAPACRSLALRPPRGGLGPGPVCPLARPRARAGARRVDGSDLGLDDTSRVSCVLASLLLGGGGCAPWRPRYELRSG